MAYFVRAWRRLWPELRRTWPVLVGLVGPISAVLVASLRPGDRSDHVRIAGTVLQALGLLLVGRGISTTRRAFNRPSVLRIIRQWPRDVWSALMPERFTIVAAAGHVHAGGVSLGASATVTGGTLDRRVERLEQALEQLQQADAVLSKRIEAGDAALRNEMLDQVKQFRAAHVGLQQRLEGFAVGDSHWEIIGFCWLVLATLATGFADLLASWSQELAR